MQEEKIRRAYVFYGSVQGVGFRYYARQAATALGITGWIQNEEDGTVSMEAQGTEEKLEKMMTMIQAGRYVEITHMDVKEQPVLPRERRFHVNGY